MTQVCTFCQRHFENLSGLSNHLGKCQAHAKRIASALNGYQEPSRPSKRQRLRLHPLVYSTSDQAEFSGNREAPQPTENHDISASTQTPEDLVMAADNVLEEARPVRQRKPNVLYKDYVDSREEFGNIAALDSTQDEASHVSVTAGDATTIFLSVCSTSDSFGLQRFYYEKPSHTPHPIALLKSGSDIPELISGPGKAKPFDTTNVRPSFGFHNESELMLADWYSRNPRNTVQSFTELRALFDDPKFKAEELPSANLMLSHLSSLGAMDSRESLPDWLDRDAGWRKSSVSISVPFIIDKKGVPVDDHRKLSSVGVYGASTVQYDKGGPRQFTIHDFYHRSIVGIIKNRLKNKAFQQMHLHPYDLRWKPGLGKATVRVYGEMFTSPYFLTEHIKVQNSAPRPHQYPRIVLALIYFSDGTQLTSFGDANFWPGYLQLGNDSKYDRMKPAMHMTEHFAYFRKLPPSFKAFVHEHNGGRKSISNILTHCRRELFHAQWRLLLDDNFVDAYENGILEECYDGVLRLFFPRIFVYSADYLEKVLIATIKYLSVYPCPQCYVTMDNVAQLGTVEDMNTRLTTRIDDKLRIRKVQTARNAVYKHGKSLQSKATQKYLGELEGSYTITMNAFSARLRRHGFNFFTMFRNEILHEWASNGEGKKLHQHLLRILDTVPSKLAESDSRYREIPSFGKDGIRKFRRNVSETSFHAARDVEDIIQCAIPVYEDLLPEPINSQILDLLYTMAEWQSLAKLRLHTDHTLHLLDRATVQLGADIRHFVSEVCPQFKTLELKHEAAKRGRRNAKVSESKDGEGASNKANDSEVRKGQANTNRKESGKKSANKPPAVSNSKEKGKSKENSKLPAVQGSEPDVEAPLQRQECSIKLNSYKLHALGHVAKSIRDLGTTESYSSEFGESEHRIGKRRYLRTDKKDYLKQLAQLDQREARLRRIRAQLEDQESPASTEFLSVNSDLSIHHEMGISQNNMIRLHEFSSKYRGDPAIWDFVPKLKWHLLPRVKALVRDKIIAVNDENNFTTAPALKAIDGPVGNNDHLYVVFQNTESIFQHNVFRVNYTGYDTRRQQDVLNPGTDHKDILLLSGSSEEPRYRYARVLGVFHCNVKYNGPNVSTTSFDRLEFLWVRWFRTINASARRLECLEFVPFVEENAFGFLDPQEVVRSAHIMPRFSKGYAHPDRKGASRICHSGSDYRHYYVGRFSDKDLYMRFLWGLGVGHKYSHSDAPADAPPGSQNVNGHSESSEPWCESEMELLESNAALDEVGSDEEEEFDDIPRDIMDERPDEEDEDDTLLFDEAFEDDDLDDETLFARYG